jgi:hypothetical protein
MTSLLSAQRLQRLSCEAALSFFKIVIGQGPDINSVTASSSVLLSCGSELLSVLLLNLLIAMFSKTFDTIVENLTQEYLLQRAELTCTWKRAPRNPPPLAYALALRDWAINMVARHMRCSDRFRVRCAGWIERNGFVFERDDDRVPPTFGSHFYRCVQPKKSAEFETKYEARFR